MNRSGNGLYDVITILFVGLTMLICVAVALMITKTLPVPTFLRPSTPTLPAVAQFPTDTPSPTITLTPLPSQTEIPTETLTPTKTETPTATSTETPLPTETPPDTLTPSKVPTNTRTPTNTKVPTATIDPSLPTKTPKGFPFRIQEGAPAFSSNLDTNVGCSFQGVGGQTFDMNNQGIQGLTIAVTSTNGFNQNAQTGSAPPNYGTAGFLVQVGQAPGPGTYTVELRNDKGVPLSPKVKVTFPGTCDQNLALINFFQTRPY